MKRSNKHEGLQVVPRKENRLEVWDMILAASLQTIFDSGFRVWAEFKPDKDPCLRYQVTAMANDVKQTTISAAGHSVREASQKIVKRLATLELLAGSKNMRQAI